MTKARDLANSGTAFATVSATELGHLDGVTSAVQTQIDSKIGSAAAINPAIVDAKGDLIVATTANTVARLAVGANATVLTADSAVHGGMKWATPASGGYTLINSGGTTLTGSTTSITSIPGTFNDLIIYVNDFSGSVDYNIFFRFNADNTGANYMQFNARGVGATDNTYVNNTTAGMDITGYTIKNTDNNNFAVIYVPNYASTIRKVIHSMASFTNSSANFAVCDNVTAYNTSSAVTGISFTATAGTFSGGTVFVYGVK